jgi:N-terminal domain of galactosyltransferase/Glycosyl transferase family 2
MSLMMPVDRAILATAVADSLVVAADPGARAASIVFWTMARPWTGAVVEAVLAARDDEVRCAGKRLLDDPASAAGYAALRSALLRRDDQARNNRARDNQARDNQARDDRDPELAAIFRAAWDAECNCRVGYHLGSLHTPDSATVTAGELAGLAGGSPLAGHQDAEVLVVIPFRDASTGGRRLRNLIACLLSLRDQSYPRERYRVTVVETDEEPRWREQVTRFADRYLFARNPGAFNKSWAVNAGVMNTPGQAEVLCILDGDVLADRDFIARNAGRFLRPGTGGHLTYRNMLCLDEGASSWAIRERLVARAALPDPDHLRGFLLRRPPGCCVWVRHAAFLRVGGMDERYEGWGGEDYDFAQRYDLAAPFDIYDDWLFHLYHLPSARLTEDGKQLNAHIPGLSWRPAEPIGRLDRFAAQGKKQ